MSAIGDFFGKVFDLGALQQMPDLLAQLIGQVSCGPKSCPPCPTLGGRDRRHQHPVQ
ncbi:MAG: hypothetical protein ACLRL4_10570 [Bifidobacterium bifidum]